nr:DUF6226 family protein [Rhodococcus sp. HNM0569]
MCALLEDVDAVFAAAGTPGWPDPHRGAEPAEDEYSRCTHPEKYEIVSARARAWTTVLRARGWVREGAAPNWSLPPLSPGGDAVVLTPTAPGAVPLVVVTHAPSGSDDLVTVTVAAGDPAVCLATVPDCGCDACDGGSDALLEDMDQWILSIVDGSLSVRARDGHVAIGTSFGGCRGTDQRLREPAEFRAAPWPAGWTSRPVPPSGLGELP